MLSRVAMPNRLFKYKASRAYNLSTAKIHGNRLGTQAKQGRHSVIIIKYFYAHFTHKSGKYIQLGSFYRASAEFYKSFKGTVEEILSKVLKGPMRKF